MVVCGREAGNAFDAEERMRKAESGGVQTGGLDSRDRAANRCSGAERLGELSGDVLGFHRLRSLLWMDELWLKSIQ